jgi:hypothetical protein
MKVSFLFAWYDLWVGFFWDKKKKWLYVLPIPTAGIIFKFLPDGYSIDRVHAYWADERRSVPTFVLKKDGYQVGGFKTQFEAIKYAIKSDRIIKQATK